MCSMTMAMPNRAPVRALIALSWYCLDEKLLFMANYSGAGTSYGRMPTNSRLRGSFAVPYWALCEIRGYRTKS